MARDRQRAKQRQAERRARLQQRRSEERHDGGDGDGAKRREASPLDEPTPADLVEIETGAPPEDVGRSDRLVASEQHPDAEALDLDVDEEELLEEEEELVDEEELAEAEDELAAEDERPARRARRDRPDAAHRREHGKVIGFLLACWAELQRVQWPDRRALTQLTGIVLLFVLIAGGYLGLLDAIFSRVIQAIL